MKEMNREDRLIFVTNDDSFRAKGFRAIVELAREFGRVIAVAPLTPQSGRSQAVTMGEPLFLDKQYEDDGVEIYSFSGTPVDCVKVFFDHLLGDRRVDLVLSGINHGSNAGINVLYSGTMGAAIEGSFYDVPAVGLSLTDHSLDADFDAAVHYGRKIVASVLENPAQGRLCLNVNVPDRQLEDIWREKFFECQNPRGRRYFWLDGAFDNYEPQAEDTDEWAIANGYVAVVPVQTDMTAYERMDFLSEIL